MYAIQALRPFRADEVLRDACPGRLQHRVHEFQGEGLPGRIRPDQHINPRAEIKHRLFKGRELA